MTRHTTTLLLCLLACSATAQINWRREIAPLACFFTAGALEGQAETLKWHPHEFQKRFPGADMNWWNPELSWPNKYRNGDPQQGPAYFGSTTFLACSTDGYHMSRSTKNVIGLTGIILTPDIKGQRWYIYLIKAAMYSVAYTAGFHVTYTLFYQP
jgi:hypothetical protein